MEVFVLDGEDEGKKSCLYYFPTNVICFFVPCDFEKIGKHCFKTKTFTHKDKNKDKERRQYHVGIFNNFLKAVKLVKKWLQEA